MQTIHGGAVAAFIEEPHSSPCSTAALVPFGSSLGPSHGNWAPQTPQDHISAVVHRSVTIAMTLPRYRGRVPLSHHTFHGSTRVLSGSYDPKSKTISVMFVDGVRWNYRGCEAQTWARFTKAASPGRFLHEELDSHPNGAG